MRKFNPHVRRSGIALPLVLLAAAIVAGFVVTTSSLNQGLRTQIFHTNNNHLSFIMSYSVLSQVMGKIQSKSWNQRPFKGTPYSEKNISLNGGTYDLFVEDSPGKTFQADVYVRTRLAQITSLYFWRIRFNDDLLDVSNRIVVDFFMRADPADFPSSSGSLFAAKIDDLMNERKANQTKSDELAKAMSAMNDPQTILSALGGRTLDSFPTGISPVIDGPEALLKEKQANPLTFPWMAPPAAGEVPDANGPGPTSLGQNPTTTAQGQPLPIDPSFPGITPSDIADLSSLGTVIEESASQSNNNIKITLQNYQNGQYDQGNQASSLSHQQSFQVLDSMKTMLGKADSMLTNAPGSDAAKAVQDLVANTGVTAMQQISQQMSTYGNQIVGQNSLNAMTMNLSIADMEQTVKNSKMGVGILENQLSSMKSISEQLGSLVHDPEIQASLNSAVQAAQATYDAAKKGLEDAEAALAAKKLADANASAGTSTGASTDTSVGTTPDPDNP